MYDEVGQALDPDTGWGHVADHDDAPAVIDAILRLDADTEYTRTELSESADVAMKTLYLDGTLEHLVEMGFLSKEEAEGEETTYTVDRESDVYAAAAEFDEAVTKRLGTAEPTS
ncbi:hypothetical protein ACFQGE_13750 [Halomicroarcula sp. GCM10025817]|uniref:hypothetical protein n=1 Tax=Haloarcula TaxID=2237 RepID=UPI0023E8B1C1|nr:hypothetical protein [Halomicroarcula sp. SYNS111]